MNIFSNIRPPIPNAAFNTFWRFAAERQRIFFSRIRGEAPPWTNDAVLIKYKFTNAYRAADRVSQFLIRQVLYAGPPSPSETFARCLLFKVFNRENTWSLISPFIETFPASSSVNAITKALDAARASGVKIFSAAYIMPAGAGEFRNPVKHRNYVQLIARMMKDGLPEKVQSAKRFADVFDLLRSYPLIGDFLALQFAIDLNYSEITHFSEMDFVTPGPGSKRGMRKCFKTLGDFTEADAIRWTTNRQMSEFDRLNLRFESLWGRPLQLIDVQNLFCEIDKYTRVTGGWSDTQSDQKRPKQLFTPSSQVIHYFFPPKWGLNSRLHQGFNTPARQVSHSIHTVEKL